MSPTPVFTALFAAAFIPLYLALAFNVIRLRYKHQVSLGHGQHSDLEKATRAHGNFAEYVPFGIILLLIAELSQVPGLMLLICGALLWIGRLSHAICLTIYYKGILRQVGMVLTFGMYISIFVLLLMRFL